MARHPICCERTDGSSYRVTLGTATELVRDGSAEWTGHKQIKMTVAVGAGIFPTFNESLSEAARSSNPAGRGVALSEDTHALLHGMRRLGP